MSDKDDVIRGIYYDKDDGFDSVINTYRKANKVLNTITVADVKSFIEKQKGLINKLNHTRDSIVMLHQVPYMNFRLILEIGHTVLKIISDLGLCFWLLMYLLN